MQRDRVRTAVKAAYSLPAIALAVVGVPIFFYLPAFYTDVVGLSPLVFGVIFLASRVFDGIADPIMGTLSDRTRTRWGRRRPFILLGALPLAGAVLMVYTPPEFGPVGSAIWFGVSIFALYLGWTLVIVPYEALGPELSYDYEERLSVLGLREGAYIVGTILAVGTPLLIDHLLGDAGGPGNERRKYMWFAIAYTPLILLSCAICARVVEERAPAESTAITAGTARQVFKNRPFRVLLISFVVAALGNNLPAVLLPYYVTYYLGSDRIHEILLTYFVLAVICVPAWLWLGRRVGKKAAWLCAMALNTLAFFPIWFLPRGAETAYWALVAISGTAGGAVVVLPPTMLADVIDYDELRFGMRREGQYVGVWFVVRKLAAAVGAGVGLISLELAGYKANVEQPPHVLTTLCAFYVLVPVVFNLVSMALAVRFPIGRAEYNAIREGIAARARGEPLPRDPLAP